MPPGDHLEIPVGFQRIQFRLADSDTNHTSTFSFDCADDGSGPSQTAADVYANAWDTNINPLIGDKITLQEIVFITGAAAPPYLSTAFAVTPTSGTSPNNSEPQVQALLKQTSATPGKHGRGRKYLPRPDGSQINSRGALTGGYMASLAAAFGAMATAILAQPPAAAPVVIFHMKNARNPTPPAPSAVTGGSVSSLVATQRRRLNR